MPSLTHLLTGEELSSQAILDLLGSAEQLKQERIQGKQRNDLAGKTLALLFEKPSFRTRLSFTIGMQELGGFVVGSQSTERKKEDPEDLARVLNGYCHGVVLRTFDQVQLERMASVSAIPILNGLSDSHHPCQVLADLLTLKQTFGGLNGLKLVYLGDGNNILHSLLLLAPRVGVHLHFACPPDYKPDSQILQKAIVQAREGSGSVTEFSNPVEAVKGGNALYTDVWTSMGFETETVAREKAFQGYQVNRDLYSHAAPGAVVMHCLPMEKDKEITQEMADHPSSVIFRQSENRLHVQKALLLKHLRG